MDQPVSTWARQRFGERAAHVRAAVVDALHAALADAQDAQKVSKSRLLFTFGVTQAARRYECIVDALKQMDGAEVVKPKGSPHELVLLEGNLIYPFRYAKADNVPIQRARVSDRKISGLIAELFERFGPEPVQSPLFGQDGDESEPSERQLALTRVPEGTKLVLISYASNDRAGVLNAWWGEGELGDRGYVRWLPGHYEQLPLNAADAGGGTGRGYGPTGPLGPVPGPRLTGPAGAPATGPRFDDGDMPAVPLSARAPVEQKNSEMYPPVTERAPETPKADEEDR